MMAGMGTGTKTVAWWREARERRMLGDMSREWVILPLHKPSAAEGSHAVYEYRVQRFDFK
jgi:hypothetical protein